MKFLPEYGVNILVAVIDSGDFHWLVTEKEDWFLDYAQWDDAFRKAGHEVPIQSNSERFGIQILDESSIKKYLTHQANCKTSKSELIELLLMYPRVSESDEVLEMMPAVFVDFDSRHLVNAFPEPGGSFEHYVPASWLGKYGSVLSHIPETERFWIIEGENYFEF